MSDPVRDARAPGAAVTPVAVTPVAAATATDSGSVRHGSTEPGHDHACHGSREQGHASHGSNERGLYGCLYQPPLPRAFAVSDVADTAPHAATSPASVPVPGGAADQERRPALAVAHTADAGHADSASAGTRPASMPLVEHPVSPLMAIAAEFSPRYEQHRMDLVSMDLRGLSRLFGSPRAIGAELRREAASRGVRVHVAIAPTRTAALVLALTRPGLTVVPTGGVARALADVSLTVLEQVHDDPHAPAGSAAQAQLRADTTRAMAAVRNWGLRTLGELAVLPAADLSARLGRIGRAWQAIARGEDTRPLVPMHADERFEGTLELEWPIEGQEPLSFVLTRLLEPLSTRLERRDRGVAVLHVTLHLVTREVHTCRIELPSPLRDVRALRTLALLDVETHPPAAAIDKVTITIEPTPGRILQHTLFARPHPTPEQLSTLLARLGALMGQDRVGAPALVDSYRPGAFAMTPFALEHNTAPESSSRPRASDVHSHDASSHDAWSHHASGHHAELGASDTGPSGSTRQGPSESRARAVGSPRETTPHVFSSSDDRPPISALRRFRHPIPARVATDGRQRPLRVFTDRHGFAGGAVVSCAGPWRTSGAWWEDEDRAPRQAGRGQASQGGASRSEASRSEASRSEASRSEDERSQDMAKRPDTTAASGRGKPGDRPQAGWTLNRGTSGGIGTSGIGTSGTGTPGIGSSTLTKARDVGGRGPWSRDEWDVALADGAVYRIFRDRTTDGWFIDGVVD